AEGGVPGSARPGLRAVLRHLWQGFHRPEHRCRIGPRTRVDMPTAAGSSLPAAVAAKMRRRRTAVVDKLETAFVDLNKWAIILLLAAMSCIVFANVSLRYLTNYSIFWAEEVARY